MTADITRAELLLKSGDLPAIQEARRLLESLPVSERDKRVMRLLGTVYLELAERGQQIFRQRARHCLSTAYAMGERGPELDAAFQRLRSIRP